MPATGKKFATEDYVNDRIRGLEKQIEAIKNRLAASVKQIEAIKNRLAASVPAVGEDGSVNYVESITTDGSGHVTAKSNKSMIFNKGHFKETG